MSKELSKHEQYLFSITGSSARTVSAQRAAIAREGLSGKKKADIRAERLKAWKEFREKPENSDLKNMPAWLLAARFETFSGWRYVAPVRPGKIANIGSLAAIAYDCVNWGNLRKHSLGSATALAPRVREEDNGKSGWDRVVFRYADYLCVKSPDGKTVAVCANRGDKIKLHTVRNGAFLHDGNRHFLKYRDDRRFVALTESTAKIMARSLRRKLPRGLDCWNDGRQVLITEKETGEVYHFDCWSSRPFSVVREAFEKRAALRRQEERNRKLDAILADNPQLVWVEFSDSITSGNCVSESARFREALSAKLGAEGELGAVRASLILSIRDDNYTRRACRSAALRYMRG